MNRKLLILSLCLFLSSNLFSQGLNLSNLMKLRTMENDEINDYLIPKGWKFIGDKNNDVVWAYGKSNEKAQFWFRKSYNYFDYGKYSVTYQSSNIMALANLKKDLINIGFTKTYATTETDKITTNYKSNNYSAAIIFRSQKTSDDYEYNSLDEKNYYTIEIHKIEPLAVRKAVENEEIKAQKAIDDAYRAEERFKNKLAGYESSMDLIDSKYNFHSEENFFIDAIIVNVNPNAKYIVLRNTLLFEYPFKTKEINREKIIAVKDEFLAVLDDKKFGDYFYVYYGDHRGFILKKDLIKATIKKKLKVNKSQDVKNVVNAPKVIKSNENIKVLGDILYLTAIWEEPFPEKSSILDFLKKNSQVEIIGAEIGFYKVKYADLIGYVNLSAVTIKK